MALAISLVFDAETTRRVDALWRALADAGISRDMLDLGYPPHVTLVVADDDGLEPQMREALAGALGAALTIKLGPVRRFEGTDITWLAADGGDDLLALHRAVADVLPLDAIRPYYRPGQWVPHMTLQTAGDAGAGRELLDATWRGEWSGVTTRLELARFLPVVVLDGMALNSCD